MAQLQQIIIFGLLPLCFGQFSIQGPSDGNRRAQGLKFTQNKGVEYTDQAESLGTGGFSITGASDGNSDFQIQGATDGNSDFRIQGATDGNSEFQIHGPTDGGSQAYIHNYDANDGGQHQNTQDHRLNYHTYDRAADNSQTQQQYQEPPAPKPVHRRPSHRRGHARVQAQPQLEQHPQPQQQAQQHYEAPVSSFNVSPIEKAPPSIQEILQFQAQIPYVNIIPEHLRFDALAAAKAQAQKFAEEYPKQVLAQQPQQVIIEEAPRSQYRSKPRQREQIRERRQASDYEAYKQAYEQQQQEEYAQRQSYAQQQEAYSQRQAYAPQHQQRRQAPKYDAYQQQQAYQQHQPESQLEQHQAHAQLSPKNYRRVNQPPAEPAPHYSTSLPKQIQEILRFQAQIPYDVIANQVTYKAEKPYVPQAAQHQQVAQHQQAAQHQQITPAQRYQQLQPQQPQEPQQYEHPQQQQQYRHHQQAASEARPATAQYRPHQDYQQRYQQPLTTHSGAVYGPVQKEGQVYYAEPSSPTQYRLQYPGEAEEPSATKQYRYHEREQ